MGKTYQNPTPFPVGDPYVMLAADGRYYMYGSSQETGIFTAHSSEDLAVWRDEGVIYRKKEGSWCVDQFWAPECFYVSGRYYLFFSANWVNNPKNDLENFRIGVAVSDTPNGPFEDLYDRPIYDFGFPIIDADLWIEDGRYYLYGSRCCYKHMVDGLEESWIYGVEIKPDFSDIIGEPKLLLRPGQEWEGRSAPTQGRRWNEGSSIIKHNGKYYMTFSANFVGEPHYAIGYATADHPLGPWTKAPDNPIVQQNAFVTGTGHNSLIRTKEGGRIFIVYHGRTEKTGRARVGFIDEVIFDEQGRMKVNGPTVTPQPL